MSRFHTYTYKKGNQYQEKKQTNQKEPDNNDNSLMAVL